jgi:hypothetical protein
MVKEHDDDILNRIDKLSEGQDILLTIQPSKGLHIQDSGYSINRRSNYRIAHGSVKHGCAQSSF